MNQKINFTPAETITIPKINRSTNDFKILKLIYEEENIFYEEIAYKLNLAVNSVRASVSRLRKKGLVITWLDWSIRLTPAGKWYYEEYDRLELIL